MSNKPKENPSDNIPIAFSKFVKTNYPLPFERYMNNSANYGKRIRFLRQEMNLSSRQLAKLINTSHSNIIKIENGSFKKINLKTLSTLSNFFNCSYVYLLGKSESRTARGTTRCFPNLSVNTALFKYLSGAIYVINNAQNNIKVTSVSSNSLIKTYSPHNRYTFNQLIHDAKNNKDGIKVSLDEHVYYIYYFTSRDFMFEAPLNNLTLTESVYANTEPKNNQDLGSSNEEIDFQFLIENRAQITDFLVIQDCSNINSPVLFADTLKDSNRLYEETLRQIFYQDGTFQLKNLPIIDLLYEFQSYINGDFTSFLISIIRAEALSEKHSFQLADIIQKFTEMDPQQRNELYLYCIKMTSGK